MGDPRASQREESWSASDAPSSAEAEAAAGGPPPSGGGTPADRLRGAAAERASAVPDYDSEENLWEGGFSGKAMLGTWLACGLLSILAIVAAFLLEQIPVLVGIGVAVALCAIVGMIYASRRFGVHYQLTSQRFIHQTGILRRVTDRIEVIDIDDVSYDQGPVQRMLGVGTIRIHSSDRTHPELTMAGIDHVRDVAGLIDDVRRKERRRHSLHIESV